VAGISTQRVVGSLLGEAALFFGHACKREAVVTLGTGIFPNIAFEEEGHSLWSNIKGTLMAGWHLMKLATDGERAHHLAKDICSHKTYFRFNMGTKIEEKRWIDQVYPANTAWYNVLANKVEKKFFEQENWEKIDIDLDDHDKITQIRDLTTKYLKDTVELTGYCRTAIKANNVNAPDKLLISKSQ
jgi:hypothetical protein